MGRSKYEYISIGDRFDRWLVIDVGEKTKHGHYGLLVICDCGTEKLIPASDIAHGKSKSCGCLANELLVERTTTHGKRYHKDYSVWKNMRSRCLDCKNKEFKNYGGRGIKVCSSWQESFDAFIHDMGERPSSNLTLERIDLNGNYEPSNCKWATPIEQARNKRNNRLHEIDGTSKTLNEWCEIYGANPTLAKSRIDRKWSILDSLTKPKGYQRAKRSNT